MRRVAIVTVSVAAETIAINGKKSRFTCRCETRNGFPFVKRQHAITAINELGCLVGCRSPEKGQVWKCRRLTCSPSSQQGIFTDLLELGGHELGHVVVEGLAVVDGG